MTAKSLDRKLARILEDPACGEFILADAKDADMAFGLAAPGLSPEQHGGESKFRTLADYRQIIRENVQQGLVDIMLMSASTSEVLTLREGIFQDSHVTPACRANDTTDIWLAQGGEYPQHPSRPFRTATIDHMMCGKAACAAGERTRGANLGLYSVTFNNDPQLDREALERYAEFRLEAEAKGFRHFLEVFDPNAPQADVPDVGRYLADMIVRTLAGVVGKGRPLFLKIPYHGPEAIEKLVAYDRSLVVGILGGSAGTTFDAFHQLAEARRYGARVALYGRMINSSEHQQAFIQHLRWIADGELTDPAEAVRSYHASLDKAGVPPKRPLEEDLQSSRRGSAYAAKPISVPVTAGSARSAAATGSEKQDAPTGDFQQMSPQDKVRWNLDRWRRILG